MAGFTAFVDESGCDGFAFDRGSSEFLVISAIICRTSALQQYADAVSRAHSALDKAPNWRFRTFKKHGGSDIQRWAIIKSFAECRCAGVAVAVHKPGLLAQGWRENAGDLYFQASKFLVERISWACRDAHRREPNEDPIARIVFSERKGLRYGQFRDYLRRLQGDPRLYGTKADWAHLDPDSVEEEPHNDDNAGHLAGDYLAAALGAALERREQGVFDDRYARLWAPKLYSSNTRVMGNGLKFWPDSGLAMLGADSRGDWMKMKLNWRV